jgi:hypothetical protein
LNVSYLSSLAPVEYLNRCLGLFAKKDKFRLILLTALQIVAGFLDLLGVGLIGVLGALGVSGIQSRQPGDRVNLVLSTLRFVLLFQFF